MLKLTVQAYDQTTDRLYCRDVHDATLLCCVARECDTLRILRCNDRGEPLYRMLASGFQVGAKTITAATLAAFKTVDALARALAGE